MRFIVIGSQEQVDQLRKNSMDVELIHVVDPAKIQAEAIFYLKEDIPSSTLINGTMPVFANSVINTIDELGNASNIFRINAWPTFFERDKWEVAGTITDEVRSILSKIGKEVISVPDVPGLVSARVISMIINEGYFAVEENVSSKEEIDTAMKLGTNYPFGPFEWSQKIGLKKILNLLNKLNETDSRYIPSDLLVKEAIQ